MALPTLTDEQRSEALRKAAQTRTERAQVKTDLKSGKITVAEVISHKDDPVVGKLRVFDLLKSLPKVGEKKARDLMSEFGISENRRVRGLGARQIEQILDFAR